MASRYLWYSAIPILPTWWHYAIRVGHPVHVRSGGKTIGVIQMPQTPGASVNSLFCNNRDDLEVLGGKVVRILKIRKGASMHPRLLLSNLYERKGDSGIP